jgi:amidophosphoribosyltransferase
MPSQAIRRKTVRQKLNPIGMEFKDQVVLLVDDSIVRGTTSPNRADGARGGRPEGVFRIGEPAGALSNVYGIDMPTPQELVATGGTEAGLRPRSAPTF